MNLVCRRKRIPGVSFLSSLPQMLHDSQLICSNWNSTRLDRGLAYKFPTLNSTDHSRFQQSDSPCAVRNVSPLFLRWFLNCYEANRLPGISCKLFLAVGKFALNINNRKNRGYRYCIMWKLQILLNSCFFLTLSFRERHAIKCFYSHFKQMKFYRFWANQIQNKCHIIKQRHTP